MVCYLIKKQSGYSEDNHLFFTDSACCKQQWGVYCGELNTSQRYGYNFKKESLIIVQSEVGSGSGNTLCCGIIKCMSSFFIFFFTVSMQAKLVSKH